MEVGLSVFGVVLAATFVLAVVGYLIDRSAFGSGRRGGR
jgi:hypothetical protein